MKKHLFMSSNTKYELIVFFRLTDGCNLTFSEIPASVICTEMPVPLHEG